MTKEILALVSTLVCNLNEKLDFPHFFSVERATLQKGNVFTNHHKKAPVIIEFSFLRHPLCPLYNTFEN